MATTVIAAFNEFMKDTVNLEKADTDDARASRDWLIGKINDFENDEVFPVSYPGIHIAFGSFARRTKIRPLDDIDLMFGLTGQGATYTILSDRVTVTSSGEGSRLHRYRHSGADTVCSVRILNAFKSRLQDVAQYAQADIRRNQEAVTLKLVSKDWNFDIVPCFITSEDAFGRTYYLIPDGNGHWKFTDPRKDRDRVTTINVQNDGNVLNVIRAVKYWQRRPTMPSMSSYLLETPSGHPAYRLSIWSWNRFSAILVFSYSTPSTIPKAYRGISTLFQPRLVRRYRTDVISMRRRHRRRDCLKIIKSMKNPSINGATCSGRPFLFTGEP